MSTPATAPDRLSLATLPTVDARRRPRLDPAALGVGIVHLGIGAFHRAHQAVYTEDAVAAAGGEWGICGVTQRSRTVVDQLGPQDGLYTVLAHDAAGSEARVVGSVRELVFAGEDPDRLRAVLAAPTTDRKSVV